MPRDVPTVREHSGARAIHRVDLVSAFGSLEFFARADADDPCHGTVALEHQPGGWPYPDFAGCRMFGRARRQTIQESAVAQIANFDDPASPAVAFFVFVPAGAATVFVRRERADQP